jgi:hypothetical protein
VYVPSSELGLPQPLSRKRVCPPPRTKRVGGHTRLRLRGWGSSNSDDWRKSLALCLLCGSRGREEGDVTLWSYNSRIYFFLRKSLYFPNVMSGILEDTVPHSLLWGISPQIPFCQRQYIIVPSSFQFFHVL